MTHARSTVSARLAWVAGAVGALGILGVSAVLGLPSLREAAMQRLPASLKITASAWRHGVRVDHGVVVTMPDGIRLASSLYLPSDTQLALPTVLIRLPYHRLRYTEAYASALFFARHGYAVLVQDLRGTGDSQGEFLPWRDVAEDGVATLDWIARQPWSTGKVGTFGCSALGETQFVLAKKNHPAHAAMIPAGAGGAVGTAGQRHGYFGLFEGGVFQLASGFGWFVDHGAKKPDTPGARSFLHSQVLHGLPVSRLVQGVRPGPNGYDDFLATPLGTAPWETWGYLSESDATEIPALVINTWGDQTVGDTLALAETWRQQGVARTQRLVIAPGKHCHRDTPGAATDSFGELPLSNAGWPREQWSLRWFDHWLRGKPDTFDDIKTYNYFMLVENRWYAADRWPPAEARMERWFLGSSGRANSRHGDGSLGREAVGTAAFDGFRYDPAHPVPSRGGPLCCTGDPADRSGPAEQSDVETRDDVLVYTSDVLPAELRIAGPLRARITVSSDAPDTDFVARLVHVWPDGRATGIQEGALRMRYRDGFERPTMMVPGQRYEVTVDMRSIAYMVPKGHRLRLHLTSSSFPRLERNLNTGAANNADETRIAVVLNRVHHAPGALSYVELPVLAEVP